MNNYLFMDFLVRKAPKSKLPSGLWLKVSCSGLEPVFVGGGCSPKFQGFIWEFPNIRGTLLDYCNGTIRVPFKGSIRVERVSLGSDEMYGSQFSRCLFCSVLEGDGNLIP